MPTQTLTEEQLPKTFPELLGQFIQTKHSKGKPTIDSVVKSILTQQFPLLSEDAFDVKRVLQVDISKIKTTDSDGKKISLKSYVNSDLDEQSGDNKYDAEDNKYACQSAFKKKPKTPEYMALIMPLFAYSVGSTWEKRGIVTHEFPWKTRVTINSKGGKRKSLELKVIEPRRSRWDELIENETQEYSELEIDTEGNSYHDIKISGKYVFRRNVQIKADTPIAPEVTKQYITNSISAYFMAYAESVQRLKLTEPEKSYQPKTGILWVPSIDSLELTVKNPRPQYKDPALIMDIGGDKYVVGIWDIEKERPIEGILREWTTGPFKGVKIQK